MSRKSKVRKFFVESLEQRQLMAGDVTVDFNGEKLEIKGDDLPNQISVFTRNGDLIVDGLGSTTVNGVMDGTGTNLGPAAALIDVVIETFGGNDRVLVQDLTAAGSIEIKTDAGDDFVAVRRVVVGNDLKVETKEGADVLRLASVFAGNSVEVDTGLGNDHVSLSRIIADNDVKVETKEGNDLVATGFLSSVTGKILLDGGSGLDGLTVGTTRGELEIKEFER